MSRAGPHGEPARTLILEWGRVETERGTVPGPVAVPDWRAAASVRQIGCSCREWARALPSALAGTCAGASGEGETNRHQCHQNVSLALVHALSCLRSSSNCCCGRRALPSAPRPAPSYSATSSLDVEGLGCTRRSGSRAGGHPEVLRPCPLRACRLLRAARLPSPGQRGSACGAAAPRAEDPAPSAS